VQCQRVIIQDSFVSGASDAGIYVGQSEDIVVRRNEVTQNVAGIEIENSHRADVYENTAHGNTGGLLIFSLPGLQVPDGKSVRAYNNTLRDNNTSNFAPAGNIVATVPAGTGALVMANTDVELFNNTVSGNQTVAVAIISYLLVSQGQELPENYDPFSRNVYVHDNTFSGNGEAPDANTQMGQVLGAIQEALPDQRVPDVVVDGLRTPGDSGPNPLEQCVGTATTSFLNLHADQPDFPASFDTNVTPYACTRAPLPEVTFAGL
jgi:parallel beta-helix repeat protein